MTMNGRQEGDGRERARACASAPTPKLPYFVVSAHYDHLGIRDGQIYPGADDDASGVAVILELAAFCQKTPFRHTILFAAFDAEERGLQGAKAFLVKPPVPKDRIALNVNLDMVSRSDKREIFVAGTYHYPDLKAPLEEVAKRAPITVLFGHDKPVAIAGGVEDWTNQSDHGPFHAAKIPFVYFGVEDHADYHKPTDTADKINRGFFVDVAETILDAVLALDRAQLETGVSILLCRTRLLNISVLARCPTPIASSPRLSKSLLTRRRVERQAATQFQTACIRRSTWALWIAAVICSRSASAQDNSRR